MGKYQSFYIAVGLKATWYLRKRLKKKKKTIRKNNDKKEIA